MKAIFTSLPDNVAVNWPDDGLSIYDFMREAEVLLNHHSTAGKEFAMGGLPVVIYSKAIHSFTTDFCIIGETETDYAQAIDEALVKGWNFEQIRLVYRWLALDHEYSTFDISDSYEAKEETSLGARIFNRLQRLRGPVWRESIDCKRRSKNLADADILRMYMEEDAYSMADVNTLPEVSLEEETRGLVHELKRNASALQLKKFPDSYLARSIDKFLNAKESLADS